jgi:hypothetical protein
MSVKLLKHKALLLIKHVLFALDLTENYIDYTLSLILSFVIV